jgi:hypothetical protein
MQNCGDLTTFATARRLRKGNTRPGVGRTLWRPFPQLFISSKSGGRSVGGHQPSQIWSRMVGMCSGHWNTAIAPSNLIWGTSAPPQLPCKGKSSTAPPPRPVLSHKGIIVTVCGGQLSSDNRLADSRVPSVTRQPPSERRKVPGAPLCWALIIPQGPSVALGTGRVAT